MWVPALLVTLTEIALVKGGNEYWYCDSLLNVRNFDPNSVSEPTGCALHEYKSENVVHCLDEMVTNGSRWLHFAYVGDSRIRYQFYSFLELLPKYDMVWKGSPERHKLQEDMHVMIPTLGLTVSYRWRQIINELVISEFANWSTPPFVNTPDLIMMGVSAHHMLERNGADHRIFERMLQRIEPHIRKISSRSKVIWMNQQPLVETLSVHKGSFVSSDKLEHYNQAARRILKDSGAIIWDSGNPVAQEYLRACIIYLRSDRLWHQNCKDFIHTGFVALVRGTQIFLNFLCNKIVDPGRFESASGIICCSP